MDLKGFRHEHKLSQSDLAELWGVSQAHVSSIEKGERNRLTPLQVRLLIDHYGRDEVARFATTEELPPVSAITSSVEISGNTAPVQHGNGNAITNDAKLVDVMAQQSAQISTLLEHQSRLISIIEKLQGNGEKE
jgi:transcriptional regulator with XRE-family HTH domain